MLNLVTILTQGQEVEFHEIEIQLFQEVEFSLYLAKHSLYKIDVKNI